MMAMLYSKPRERHVVLSHISAALRDVKEKNPVEDVPVSWKYGEPADYVAASSRTSAPSNEFSDYSAGAASAEYAPQPQQLDSATAERIKSRFIERCLDYKASVITVNSESDLPDAIAAESKRLGLQSLVVPSGITPSWLDGFFATGLYIVQDTPPLSKQELSTIDGVLTASALAIAETGTIALDHSANQGRRIITLLPHTHLCVVRAADIVSSVPEAVQLLKPSLTSGSPATWISGPSATVDIEFSRVEGVHGPHQLSVFIV